MTVKELIDWLVQRDESMEVYIWLGKLVKKDQFTRAVGISDATIGSENEKIVALMPKIIDDPDYDDNARKN